MVYRIPLKGPSLQKCCFNLCVCAPSPWFYKMLILLDEVPIFYLTIISLGASSVSGAEMIGFTKYRNEILVQNEQSDNNVLNLK